MKRVMARMESEKESQTTKYQDPEQWRGCFKDYVKFANKMQSVSESDSFNLFIIGVIIAAGIVVGFQTYASNDPVYFCASAMPPRLKRCTDATGACVFFSLLLLLLLFAFVFFFLPHHTARLVSNEARERGRNVFFVLFYIFLLKYLRRAFATVSRLNISSPWSLSSFSLSLSPLSLSSPSNQHIF